jgi:hypothetical protein
VYLTVLGALFAEGLYFLTKGSGSTALGDAADPFHPSVIPFNVGVICCGYLAGMWLVRPERRRWIKKATRVGSDDSYGIFLAQMIFITALAVWGGRDFAKLMPFYVWIPASIMFAYFGSIALTELLARTPLAVPLTGRKQIPWRAPRPAGSAQAGSAQSGSARSGSARAGSAWAGSARAGSRRAGSHRKVAAAAVPAGAVPAGAAIPALSAPVGVAAAPPHAAPDRTPAPAPAPAARDRESTTLAATACDQNGA